MSAQACALMIMQGAMEASQQTTCLQNLTLQLLNIVWPDIKGRSTVIHDPVMLHAVVLFKQHTCVMLSMIRLDINNVTHAWNTDL